MALIQCKECGSAVSSKAETCPKCGVKIARKSVSFSGILSAFVAVFILYSCGSVLVSMNGSKDVPPTPPVVPAAETLSSVNRVESTCNKGSATTVKQQLSALASDVYSEKRVELRWNPGVMDGVDKDQAKKVMIAFADADACLYGIAREIRYFKSGKLWAVMSPASGFFWI